MLPNIKNASIASTLRLLACVTLAATLAACGGGGGSPGTVGGGSGGSANPADPRVAITLVDGTGKAVSALSGGQTGTVRATLTDGKGALAAGQIVAFSASDASLIEFTPASGSALTDASGVAVINIKPASVTAAGALSITATGTVAGRTGTATINLAVGAAPLTVGALSFTPAPSGRLPAFSAITLNIPVTSGGQPATTVTGLSLESLCVGDAKATLVPGSLSGGVQTATYTNNGCLRGNDTITVRIGNSTQTISLGVDPANIGTIQFVGSDLAGASIVIKGSGGQGRKESALLTFKVLDQNNQGLAGVDVEFSATTTTGGLTVAPAKGTTDANGNVTTTVSSGTIPTPVRVNAKATRNGTEITGLSDLLTISTGLPVQGSMSLSFDSLNIEGLDYDNVEAQVTVLLADQFGNRIADGTAVTFVSEGGAIGSSGQGACTTVEGGCSVVLRSQAFRPANGRVSVLAFVQGLENFTDLNGDGKYSCTNFKDPSGAVPPVYRPLVDTCVSGGEPWADQGDPFLDSGSLAATSGVPAVPSTLDGVYHPANDRPFPYGHATYTATGNGAWGLNFISRSAEVTFSGSSPTLVRQVCSGTSCRDWRSTDGNPSVIRGAAGAACSNQMLTFRLFDANNNPMPSQTSVSTADVEKVSPLSFSPDKVPSTSAVGGTIHSVVIKPDTTCSPGYFSIRVSTPKGVSTLFPFTAPAN